MTTEEKRLHKKMLAKRYRRRNRVRIREYERSLRNGTHKLWWTLARRKAGIDV